MLSVVVADDVDVENDGHQDRVNNDSAPAAVT